jgi:CubicO group peptidase (beta-lactamase class C family)
LGNLPDGLPDCVSWPMSGNLPDLRWLLHYLSIGVPMFTASRHFMCVLLLCLLLQPALPPAGTVQAQSAVSSAPIGSQDAQAFFDAALNRYLQEYHIAGATLAVVQDGAVLFTRGYGLADVEQGAPVNPEKTLFRIGSLTKLFTWTAAMQLVEQGKLDLHADVNRYLDFALPATYAEPITLWHLLTHTAGFENRNLGYAAAGAADLQPLGVWLATHIPARVRPPGAAAAYSNYGSALAGYIVERVSGLPYEEYIRRRILQPLNMQQTAAAMVAPAEPVPAVAHGYTFANGVFAPAEPPLLQVGPAGEIAATAADMAQFLLAHLGEASNGAHLLADDTLAEMHATAYRADPTLNGMALGFFELSRHGEHMIGHVGAALPSFHSLAVLLPERGLGFFVSFNSAGAQPLTTGASAILLRDFADAFFPTPDAAPLVAPADFDARAAAYTGSYRFANNPTSSTTTLEKSAELLGGAVTLTAPGDGSLHLTDAWGEKRFVETSVGRFRQVDGEGQPGDDALALALDERGQATGLYLSSRSSQLFERLAWWQTPGFHQMLLALCALLFLSVVIAAGAAWLFGRGAGVQPRTALLARRLALAAALLNLLFLVAYVGVMLLAPQSIALGQVALLGGVLALPVLALLPALAAAICAWGAWKGGYWGLPARLHYTAAVLSLFAFAWLLNQWNLLGWRF